MVKLFKVAISLPEFSVDVEAEDEGEAYSRAEEFILRAMEKGFFRIKVEEERS